MIRETPRDDSETRTEDKKRILIIERYGAGTRES